MQNGYSIDTAVLAFVALAVFYTVYVIRFASYKDNKKIMRNLYITVLTLLISLILLNNTGLKTFMDRYNNTMVSNCQRLIENTHESVLKDYGICSNKYNFRNQGIDDNSQKRFIWENYATTYKDQYALINQSCCQNIQKYYNAPFVLLYNSVYMLITLQILMIVFNLTFIIKKNLFDVQEDDEYSEEREEDSAWYMYEESKMTY